MKKLLFTVISLITILIILSACSSNTEGDANKGTDDEKITLRVSSGLADVHIWFQTYFKPWMEQIEKETNGKVKFDVFTSGSLVPIRGEMDALKNGTIDIAMPLFPIYEPSRFPLTEVTMLPLTKTDAVIAAKAYNELLNSSETVKDDMTYQDYDFLQHDLKVFPIPPIQAYVLSSVNRKFDSIESFKGALIRTSGTAHELLAKNLGANPTTISASDLFEAINRGTVDANLQAIADWRSYGLDEILKHTIDGVHMGHFSAVLAMTKDKWESLPEDVQQAIEKATNDLLIQGGEKWEEVGEEVKNFNIENGGEFTNVNDLDSETKEFIMSALEKTWFDWIENLEKQGHPGKEIAILWRDLIIKHGGEVPDKVKDLK